MISSGNQTNDSSASHADKDNKIAQCPYQFRAHPLTHWFNEERANSKDNL